MQALGERGKLQGPPCACGVGKLPGPRLIHHQRGGWYPASLHAGMRSGHPGVPMLVGQWRRRVMAADQEQPCSQRQRAGFCMRLPFPESKTSTVGCHGVPLSCVSEAKGCCLYPPSPCYWELI